MIPKLHYISQGTSPEEHLENITQACNSGAELVQLRLLNVTEDKLLKIATQARDITGNFHTRLVITDHYKIAREVKADGVHLENSEVCPLEVRRHAYTWQIIGGTANTLEDCKALLEKNIDYIGLGPFRVSQTKENLNPVLGLDAYRNILQELKTDTAIFAVGGIRLEDVAAILKTGIDGIAVSKEISMDFNKISQFHKLLQTGSANDQVWQMDQDN